MVIVIRIGNELVKLCASERNGGLSGTRLYAYAGARTVPRSHREMLLLRPSGKSSSSSLSSLKPSSRSLLSRLPSSSRPRLASSDNASLRLESTSYNSSPSSSSKSLPLPSVALTANRLPLRFDLHVEGSSRLAIAPWNLCLKDVV